IPALGAPPEALAKALGFALLKASFLIGVLLYGGPRIMRWWLTLVARRRTELAGLSLALGAFIAGMLVSETEYKHQVETDIRPFHDVLLGLFFITVGMLLDWRMVAEHWGLVLVLITLPVLVKASLVAGLARLFGAAAGVSLRTGL